MKKAALATLGAIFFVSSTASTEPMELTKVPPPLKNWVDWVLYDAPKYGCPDVNEEAVCLWPGRLELSLNKTGGTFEQNAYADRDGDLPLPGNTLFWPQDVKVDGKQAVVINRETTPVVHLTKGAHRISGRFKWDALPEGIDVPPSCGVISLTVDGSPSAVKRDESGRLWLAGGAQTEDKEQLSLSVQRKITDGIPMKVETRLSVRASGKAREVTLDNVLPKGTVAISAGGDLPVRFDPNGNLKLQVRPGNHIVEISARTESQPDALSPSAHDGPWPEEEIWTWQADEALRQVKVEGAPGIDPSRTDLPEKWRSLPAFVLTEKSALKFITVRRGETNPPPDRIHLRRSIWMDLDQKGFTVRDSLTGALNRTWRLDLEAKGTLGRVSIDGEDRLITKGKNQKPGVEIRKGKLDMTAEWHTNSAASDLPAAGWSHDVESIGTTVHLPPGWTLLFAKGADSVTNTWWDKWDLFGFFFVLIIAAGTAKLIGLKWGAVALVGLVLAQHEPDVPRAAWPMLLIAVALLKGLKDGKLRTAVSFAFWAAVLWSACVIVPFCTHEIRSGIYPQISTADTFFDDSSAVSYGFLGGGGEDTAVPQEEVTYNQLDDQAVDKKRPRVKALESRINGSLEQNRALKSKRRGPQKQMAKKYRALKDPKVVVQTGMGIPTWKWNTRRLEWSGPVKKDHRVSLFMLSPRINMILSFFRVILLCMLFLKLIQAGRIGGSGTTEKKSPPAAAAALLLISLFLPSISFAQPAGLEEEIPALSDNLLDTLRERLTAAPDCSPDCVSVSRLDITIRDDTASMTAEVHAKAPSGVALPGPAKNWTPETVSLDGLPASALVLREDGFLHLRVEKGVHTVTLSGAMPNIGAMVLSLGTLPKQVTVNADNWSVDGLRENNQAEGSLQFTRLAQPDAPHSDGLGVEEVALSPWLEVTRQLELGVTWTVNTTVRRVSPPGTPVLLTVPLLPNESVTQSDLKVTDEGVVVSMKRDETSIFWTSTLKEQKIVSLVAPENLPWSEVWTVQCGTVLQCEFEGIAPVAHKTDGAHRPLFKPRPGETVRIKTSKPEGAKGVSITVDSTELTMIPGTRLSTGTLSLKIRTSRGGEQKIVLPSDAEVQTLTLDEKEHPFQKNGGEIVFTLKPGAQTVFVEWQMSSGLSTHYRTPEVRLEKEAANVRVTVRLPDDRWLLWAGGPSWGPAILFWGFLIAVLLAGFILGRYTKSPLKSYQWMLLFVGLTQIPVPVSLVIVSWILLIERRRNRPFNRPVLFNLTQIFLAILTAATLLCLGIAVYAGLAVQPDMQVQGMDSTNTALNWYMDRISNELPNPWVISVPVWVWKIIMLAWALWLAALMIKWLLWAWRSWTDGGLWKKSLPKPAKPTEKPVEKK